MGHSDTSGGDGLEEALKMMLRDLSTILATLKVLLHAAQAQNERMQEFTTALGKLNAELREHMKLHHDPLNRLRDRP